MGRVKICKLGRIGESVADMSLKPTEWAGQ